MLVEALEQKQKELGLTQTDMARRLGISEAMWSLVRRDLRNPGKKFIRAVLQGFPEFSSEALIYLRDNVPTERYVEPQETHQGARQTAKRAVAVSEHGRRKNGLSKAQTEGGA